MTELEKSLGRSWKLGKGDLMTLVQRGPSPRVVVTRRVGEWPQTRALRARSRAGATGIRGRSLSEEHAGGVWLWALEVTRQKSESIAAQCGGDPTRMAGVVDLTFIGALGDHIGRCKRCWSTGLERDVPVAWLTWVVASKPNLKDIWRAARLEARTQIRGAATRLAG